MRTTKFRTLSACPGAGDERIASPRAIGRRASWIVFVLLLGGGCRPAESTPAPAPLRQRPPSQMEVLDPVREKLTTGKNLERIAAAVEQFQVRFGRTPSGIKELIDLGFLDAPPDAPEAMVYVIDPRSGNVSLVREAGHQLRTRASSTMPAP